MRMMTLAKRENELSDEMLMKIMVEAYPIMVYTKQLADGSRRIMEITEAEEYWGDELHWHSMFKYDVENQTHKKVGGLSPKLVDCLLKNGASEVYAVDSGRDQLNPTLLRDERVHSYESMNARYLDEDTFPTKFDIAVMDVSFSSQTLLYKSVSNVLKENGIFISLIKPQFEAGKKFIGKGGIVVKDKAVYESVIKNVCYEASKHGLSCQRIAESPILGKDGNKEFLALFVSTGSTEATVPEISGSKG
jgi:23S rRNA (cytidine1920-2'-O)/16S rRNA (cytidine1409-2'-O)-methyltransferase